MALCSCPDAPSLIRAAAVALAKAIEYGDVQRIEWLTARLFGKVKDEVEVTLPKPMVIRRRNGETLELGAKVEGESQ